MLVKRLTKVAIAASAIVVSGALGVACQTPCESTADCGDLYGCRDGFCVQECLGDDDCPVGTDCDGHGLCELGAAGAVSFIDPAPDSEVGARFDATVEVAFRAPSAVLR